MDLGLKNKVIVVTGGSKGIGGGIVCLLANEGAIPVILGRNKESIFKEAWPEYDENLIKEESTGKTFVKVGITSKRFIMRRFSKAYGYEGYVVETILRRIDTSEAERLESEIKDKLNKKRSVKKYRPILESFSGYSECFDFMCLEDIIKIFDERLSAIVSFFFGNYWIDVTFKK